MKRGQVVVALAAVVAVLTSGAVYAASQARTPGQRAAQAEAPTPSTITAAVRQGQLSDEALLEGIVDRSGPVDIYGPAEVSGAALLVVTDLNVQVGDQVAAGEVVAEVSGRPVIVLAGGFPQYRDLHSGMTGPDVRQLQAALQPLFGTPVDGEFGRRTEQDLLRLYDRAGYLPVLDAAVPEGARTPTLPVGEVVFVRSTPAYVGAVSVQVGTQLAGPMMTLRSDSWEVVAPLTAQTEHQLLDSGELRFGDGPLAGEAATLVEVRESEGDGAETTPSRVAVFAVDSREHIEPMAAQQVVLQQESSEAHALIVPVTALRTGPDGVVTVTVVDGPSERVVPVDVGLSVRGEAVVEPLPPAELTAGDEVLLAYRQVPPQ